MPEKGISTRSGGTGENPIHIREHLGQKNEDELFEAVWDELEHSEDGADVDVDKILTYMDIMDDINPLPDIDLSSSWKEFEEKYGPVTDGPEPAKQQLPVSDSPVTNKRRHRRVKPIRALLVVLCVSVLLVIASSCGVIDYIINAVARWTDEIFRFDIVSESFSENVLFDSPDTIEYDSLESALSSYGIETIFESGWCPDGFELYQIKAINYADSVKIKIDYRNKEKQLGLSIIHYKDMEPLKARESEKDTSSVIVYECAEQVYYIMGNNMTTKVMWVDNMEVYTISGDISIAEIKEIVNSFAL